MRLVSPIKNFGRRAIVAAMTAVLILVNRYEAGQRWSMGRSYLPGELTDARFDADSATRGEIVRKSRYFERNNALMNRLCDIFEQYTVGHCGIPISPNSSEPEWNEAAMEWMAEWSPFCDLTSLQSLASIQSLAARLWFVDGEVFILKTHGEEITGEVDDDGNARPLRRPRIQLIESHRVATPPAEYMREGKTIVDGVEIDSRGRPTHYWVRSGFDETSYRAIPADRIIHIFEPSRASQYRGLPFTYSVLNDLHDLDDLEILEMRAARDAAEKSTFIETPSGELDADIARQQRYSTVTQKSDGTPTTENRTKFIKDSIGGRVAALRIGEKVTQFLSNRPTVTQQWYWDYLTSKICAGVGISKLLVYPWSMQGTVTRSDLDVMAGYFRARSAVLAAGFVKVWEYVIGWAVKNDVRLADPPSDWRKVSVRAPRSVNVDVGRNSAAMIAEVEAKLRTVSSVFAELGEDWRDSYRQIAIEERYKADLEKEFKLTPGTMSKAIREAISKKSEAKKEEEPEKVAA